MDRISHSNKFFSAQAYDFIKAEVVPRRDGGSGLGTGILAMRNSSASFSILFYSYLYRD